MPDKRMLIVPSEVLRKIEENRGDMSQSEFINFLIDSQLEQKSTAQLYVTKEALQEFEQGIKDLLRSFLEFFISYGLEVGRRPAQGEVEALSQRLEALRASLDRGQATMPKT